MVEVVAAMEENDGTCGKLLYIELRAEIFEEAAK